MIDTATREVTNRIDVGPNPIQMIATPDGRFVYVANQGTEAEPNDTVSVIDLSTNQTVSTVAVGDKPNGISYSPQPPTPGPATISVSVPDYATGAEGNHAEH